MLLPRTFSFAGALVVTLVVCSQRGQDTSAQAPSNDGSQLLHLDASHIDAGILPDERLSPRVAMLTAQDPSFNPGKLADGINTTWSFKTSTDNAIATLRVSSEGTTVGARPNGFAQLQINAQDEVPNPPGPPRGNNMSGYLRVASTTFNDGQCRNTFCPDTTELVSDKNLRLTVSGTGVMSFVQSNGVRLVADSDGFLKAFTTIYGIASRGRQAFQLGDVGMEIGGDRGLYSPPRYPPADAMSDRHWVDGSLRVGGRVGIGCDVSSPFGRPVDGEFRYQAGLCVQPNGQENIGAHITTPTHDSATEAVGLRVDTRATNNIAANVGILVLGGNRNQQAAEGGQTGARIVASKTSGPDYGIDLEAEADVEYPLAVRVNGIDRFLICGNGGLLVGLPCDQSRGPGSINLAGDLYQRGTSYRNPDYVFEHFYTGQMDRSGRNPGASSYAGLLGLSDLEAFTRATHQLPGIAGATGMFERQDALLVSLEQAYLYIFQLEQQLQQLHTRLADLERRPK